MLENSVISDAGVVLAGMIVAEDFSMKLFSASLEADERDALVSVLREFGVTADHPIEAFFTIIMGAMVIHVDTMREYMLMMAETEEERQEMQNELKSDSFMGEVLRFKESIHPDDLLLLNENYDSLSVLMPVM